MPRAIVLVLDGLGAKYVGPYGNTSIETAAFNQLASESVLFENVFAPFADFRDSFDALLRGRSTIGAEVAELGESDLIRWLNENGTTTKLFTDDPEVVDHPLAAHFAEQLNVAPATGIKLADEWDETHAAQYFAQAINAIGQLEDNSLLWLHTRGLGNPWDAPYEFRSQFVGEEDPDPSGSAQVPSLQLDADYDPDTLHEIQCAYAGQVAMLDQCLGVLLTVLNEPENDNVLFAMTSTKGFPLGEHLQVGWGSPTLHHELLHVPAMIRFPDRSHMMRRASGLGELSDVTNVLLRWFQSGKAFFEPRERKYTISRSSEQSLFRTSVWQLCVGKSADDDASAELYLKPDDQNEVNDVADRRPDVVDAGQMCLRSILADANADVHLPDVLFEPPS